MRTELHGSIVTRRTGNLTPYYRHARPTRRPFALVRRSQNSDRSRPNRGGKMRNTAIIANINIAAAKQAGQLRQIEFTGDNTPRRSQLIKPMPFRLDRTHDDYNVAGELLAPPTRHLNVIGFGPIFFSGATPRSHDQQRSVINPSATTE